jgi:hypothetical protein
MKVKDIKEFISIVIPNNDEKNFKEICEQAYLKQLKYSINNPAQSKKKLFDIVRNSEKLSKDIK